MNTELQLRTQLNPFGALWPEFRWLTNEGLDIRPSEMATGHLFNSVMMMWHNCMPADATMYAHRKWRLGRRFTEDYIRLATRVLLLELVSRPDLNQFHLDIIRRMQLYLNRNQGRIAQVLRIEDCAS